MSEHSPTVDAIEWGSITVSGHGTFKDVKLWPGGARAWDWGETGTRHEPGIQPADVIVLSKGYHERLQTCPETLAWLEERGVEVHQLQTERAAEEYARLRETRKVGALLHSTC